MGITLNEKMTKKQHYVPQFYLKYFSSDGKRVCVYDRNAGCCRMQSIRDTCASNYLYDVRSTGVVDGFVSPNTTENKLSELESRFSRVLGDVLDTDLNLKDREIAFSKNRHLVESFCANLIFRSPETMAAFMDFDETRETLLSSPEDSFTEDDLELMDIIFGSSDYAMEESLKRLLSVGSIAGERGGPQADFAKMLAGATMVVGVDCGGNFVTSSRPFFVQHGNEGDDFFAYIPLSSFVGLAFVGGPKRTVLKEVSGEDAKDSNRLILSMDRADWRYGIARRRETLLDIFGK